MQFTLLNQESPLLGKQPIEAFPERRLPFDQLLMSSQAGKFHLFVIQEADENVGILLSRIKLHLKRYVFSLLISTTETND